MPRFRLSNLSDMSLRWFTLTIIAADFLANPASGVKWAWLIPAYLAYTLVLQATAATRENNRGLFIVTTAIDLAVAFLWTFWHAGAQKFSIFHLPTALLALRRGWAGAVIGAVTSAILYFAASASLAALTPGLVAQRVMFYLATGLVTAFVSREIKNQKDERNRLEQALRELEAAHESIKEVARVKAVQATTDGLTGLHNHAYLQERVEEEVRRTFRYGRPTSLIMIDLDNFKKFNDTFGHLKGNDVLKEAARGISESVRAVDLVARYGGDEFAVLLPETDTEDALQVAERIRFGVLFRLAGTAAGEIGVTLSLGVATVPNHARNRLELLERADQAMYLSKKAGKNRVQPSA